jgi:hypothetical protein
MYLRMWETNTVGLEVHDYHDFESEFQKRHDHSTKLKNQE